MLFNNWIWFGLLKTDKILRCAKCPTANCCWIERTENLPELPKGITDAWIHLRRFFFHFLSSAPLSCILLQISTFTVKDNKGKEHQVLCLYFVEHANSKIRKAKPRGWKKLSLSYKTPTLFYCARYSKMSGVECKVSVALITY